MLPNLFPFLGGSTRPTAWRETTSDQSFSVTVRVWLMVGILSSSVATSGRNSTPFIGLIDAELRGAEEYKTGGLPPFRKTRVRAPFAVHEFLERACRSLEKLGVTTVVSLFVDELAVYQEPEGKEANLKDVLALARDRSSELEAANSFHVMLMHEDDDFTHVISIEGSVDHVVEAPAISVVDIARSVTEEAALADRVLGLGSRSRALGGTRRGHRGEWRGDRIR